MAVQGAENELIRIYSKLLAKREHMPVGNPTEKHVQEFNALVDRAAVVRTEDLGEFKIKDSDILRPPFRGRTGGEPRVELPTYLERIDALIAYVLGTLPPETARRMGFQH
jgi:hypothetical protein